jgi:ABC-type nickel/cobalt efflux system permease component RcnA
MSWLAVIGLVLTCAIGIWKFVARLKSEKRKLADEARTKLDEAKKTSNNSDFLDAFERIDRLQ